MQNENIVVFKGTKVCSLERTMIPLPNIINNNKCSVISQVRSKKGSVYANLTPTLGEVERLNN
uniref:Uncharacterized protein n=1 Tax=Solanum tuberosum TaxID=4113 RepID=M1BIE8_SOLTU